MNYNIKDVLKEKKFKSGKIILVDLKSYNLISIQVFDEDNNLIESLANPYREFDKSNVILRTKRKYKEKLNQYFYKNP